MKAYDSAGNLSYERKRDGNYVNYGYDALDRMTSKDGPNALYWETDQFYSYDNLGRLTGASDSLGHWVAFGYDALGRRLTEDRLYYGTKTSQYELSAFPMIFDIKWSVQKRRRGGERLA